MSKLISLLSDPMKRTPATYRFKVISFLGNRVSFQDASKVVHHQELPNDGDVTLEKQYVDLMDNLFLAITISGEYYFTTRLSNNKAWPQ